LRVHVRPHAIFLLILNIYVFVGDIFSQCLVESVYRKDPPVGCHHGIVFYTAIDLYSVCWLYQINLLSVLAEISSLCHILILNLILLGDKM
jgi:hypothetical protein